MSAETDHMRTMLKTAMRILGYSSRDVERKLGVSSSYVTRILSRSELRFQHVVDISRAIGMEPEEMLHFAFKPPQEPSAAALRLRKLLHADLAPAPAPAAPMTQEAIEELVAQTFRKLFRELAEPKG